MNRVAAYTLFDTAIGRCGMAWREQAVGAFALPGADDVATIDSLRRRCPEVEAGVPNPAIDRALGAVGDLLAGKAADLSFIEVDLDGVPPFERTIYAALRLIGPGATITYGELARRCGSPGAARAVGAAMGRNPVPVIIPCHRVLASNGKSGGFSAPGGTSTKFALLRIEQARRGNQPMLFQDLPLEIRP